MAKPQIQCPAAQERHPVLSPHPLDVECRVTGLMRPARSSPDAMGGRSTVVCCDAYANCAIWQRVRAVEMGGAVGNPTQRQRSELIAPRTRDTLSS